MLFFTTWNIRSFLRFIFMTYYFRDFLLLHLHSASVIQQHSAFKCIIFMPATGKWKLFALLCYCIVHNAHSPQWNNGRYHLDEKKFNFILPLLKIIKMIAHNLKCGITINGQIQIHLLTIISGFICW